MPEPRLVGCEDSAWTWALVTGPEPSPNCSGVLGWPLFAPSSRIVSTGATGAFFCTTLEPSARPYTWIQSILYCAGNWLGSGLPPNPPTAKFRIIAMGDVQVDGVGPESTSTPS